MPMPFVAHVLRSGFMSLYNSSAPLQPAELIQPPELIIRLLGDIMVHCTSCETDVMA